MFSMWQLQLPRWQKPTRSMTWKIKTLYWWTKQFLFEPHYANMQKYEQGKISLQFFDMRCFRSQIAARILELTYFEKKTRLKTSSVQDRKIQVLLTCNITSKQISTCLKDDVIQPNYCITIFKQVWTCFKDNIFKPSRCITSS